MEISTEWYNKMAERLTELEYKEAERRWIPISEKLPELDEEVIATTAWNDVTIAWRIGIKEWFIHEGEINAETDDIIAWMPRPKPYEIEQK